MCIVYLETKYGVGVSGVGAKTHHVGKQILCFTLTRRHPFGISRSGIDMKNMLNLAEAANNSEEAVVNSTMNSQDKMHDHTHTHTRGL